MQTQAPVGQWDKWSDDGLRARLLELRMEIDSIKNELTYRGKIKHARFTRTERFEQIKRLLADGLIRTTSQVAKELGMSPSNHLRNILCEVYRNGDILGYAANSVAGHPVYHWYIQATLPRPSPDFQRNPVCGSVTEAVEFPS